MRQAASKESGRTSRRIERGGQPAGRSARRTRCERSGRLGHGNGRHYGKQSGSRIEIEDEVRVGCRRRARLGLDLFNANRRRAPLGVRGVRRRGGRAQFAGFTGARVTRSGQTAGMERCAVLRHPFMLHGAAGRARMTVQALPGCLRYDGHCYKCRAQEPGQPSVVVKPPPLHRINSTDSPCL
jgi:hypothetical protein